MTEVETKPATGAWDIGGAGMLRQLYATTLLDLEGGRALEWAYVPGDLLETRDLGGILQALELELVTELPSVSALPAAIAAMLETEGSPDQLDELRVRLDQLLGAPLGQWSDSVDLGAVTFAQVAAFSAVLPVEWSPLRKVPVADAAFKQVTKAAVSGFGAGAMAGGHLAVVAGVHGAAVILVGAGGAVLGTLAAPAGVIVAAVLARKLLRHPFR